MGRVYNIVFLVSRGKLENAFILSWGRTAPMNIYYKGKFICVKTQGYKIYKIYYFLRMYVQNYKHKLPMNINYKGKSTVLRKRL